jgi:hypothetical protein
MLEVLDPAFLFRLPKGKGEVAVWPAGFLSRPPQPPVKRAPRDTEFLSCRHQLVTIANESHQLGGNGFGQFADHGVASVWDIASNLITSAVSANK